MKSFKKLTDAEALLWLMRDRGRRQMAVARASMGPVGTAPHGIKSRERARVAGDFHPTKGDGYHSKHSRRSNRTRTTR